MVRVRGREDRETNSANVKPTSFPGQGRDPSTLIGLPLIACTPEYAYPLTLTFRQRSPKPLNIEIHSTILGRFFNIETCDLLKTHLPKATRSKPLKVIATALGSKEVIYAAPLCIKKRRLQGKRQVDKFNLIGIQLEGMDEMGWIWAEDMERSFEEGKLHGSVYIATEPVDTNHVPVKRAELSESDTSREQEEATGDESDLTDLESIASPGP
ncbi:hypothetical protein ABW20_dc0105445 [Dactylellina cionopaga]|nr:hypothetical protein ABW20_dc0105445 [Dactylellina cionopaga]